MLSFVWNLGIIKVTSTDNDKKSGFFTQVNSHVHKRQLITHQIYFFSQ